ncbi:MAG: carbonate dehydratase [Rubricoccaceae bacterium]|nr:carbonate dehydratase [Rubricoccaceae bacterium]
MRLLPHFFENNHRWAEGVERDHPGFFTALAEEQAPSVLWIGCADSRVPANQITGLMPGEVFVHRNVANVLAPSDLNALAVLQYAVEMLKVEHVVVCGHYGCGGVRAVLDGARLGLIDSWLLHVKNVRWEHRDQLDALDDVARFRRLCELNVIEQVGHVAETAIVQEAWAAGQSLAVHGWIYDLGDGHLRDLDVTSSSAEEFERQYAAAVAPPAAP